MNAIAPTEFNPSLAVINGTIKTTSLKVAEHFGKQHKSVLRSIKNLDCSSEFSGRNFALTSTDVIQPNGGLRKEPSYEMTKDGFTFLAMGFTGKEAAKWKEAYINAFNAMAEQLSSNPLQLEPKTKKALPNGLTLEQQDCIKALVRQRVAELPKDKQAKAAITCWSSIKSKYGKTYKAVEPEHFTNIVSLLGRLPLEGELVEKPKQDALTINLKFPDGMRTMTMQFETSEFQHGRWLVSLMDGNLSIQAMTEYELSMTMDQWIRYATRDLGYVVIKKDEFHVGNFVMEQLPAHLLPILVEKAGRRLSAIRV